MPYYIGGLVDDVDDLIARTPEEFRERGIDARTGHDVEAINLDDRTVTVHCIEAGTRTAEPFDQLVIATGAAPIRPDLPGISASGVFGMSSMADMLAVESYLDGHDVERAVIVGGGYIGIEMAESFLLRDIDVTLIHSRPTVMPTLDADVAEQVNDAMTDAGVRLITGERAVEFTRRGGMVTGVRTPNRDVNADIVVLGLGTNPRSSLARDAGLPVGTSGGIVVDDRMCTPVDGVWAAGDCTEMHHLVSGKPVSFALGTIANKQGRVCGINLSGGSARFPGVLGTAITKFCDLEIARTGLSAFELDELGWDYVSGTIKSSTRSGYFPGSSSMTVKMTADRGSGRILGSQIVGGPGAGKRIDTITTALNAGMTVGDLEMLDLSYAPPFSPVWDPTQIAARITNQAR